MTNVVRFSKWVNHRGGFRGFDMTNGYGSYLLHSIDGMINRYGDIGIKLSYKDFRIIDVNGYIDSVCNAFCSGIKDIIDINGVDIRYCGIFNNNTSICIKLELPIDFLKDIVEFLKTNEDVKDCIIMRYGECSLLYGGLINDNAIEWAGYIEEYIKDRKDNTAMGIEWYIWESIKYWIECNRGRDVECITEDAIVDKIDFDEYIELNENGKEALTK